MSELLSAWSEEQLKVLFDLYKQRSVDLKSLTNDILALSDSVDSYDLSLISKWFSEYTLKLLIDYRSFLLGLDVIDASVLLDGAKAVVRLYDRKLVELAQALRLALTGRSFSPSVFDLMPVLGRSVVINRVELLIDAIKEVV